MSAVAQGLRSLIFRLCEPRDIPVLVTDRIADHLDERDLLKINLLSREFNWEANAIIYRDIVIDLDGSQRAIAKSSLLLRTLLTSSTAASAVRSLSLTGEPLEDLREEVWQEAIRTNESVEGPLRGRPPPDMQVDVTGFTAREIECCHKGAALWTITLEALGEAHLWALCLHIFRLTSSIEHLTVDSDYFRYPDFRDALQRMAREGLFQELQSCDFCLDLAKGMRRRQIAVRDWDSTLLALFEAPNIKSIGAVVSLQSQAVRQLRPGGRSNITRLTLHHYQTEKSDLQTLLAMIPRLQYLQYHATTDYAWLGSPRRRKEAIAEHAVGLDPLFDALHHVADSLQELHTSDGVDEDSLHFQPEYAAMHRPPFRPRTQLSRLKQVHTLSIPYLSLLGWRRRDCDFGWDEILPPSLGHIVLTDSLVENYGTRHWTDETLMPVFSEIVEFLSAKQTRHAEAAFGLCLFEDGYEFNEPVRQELTRMCEERGVRCTIEKKCPDRKRPPPRPYLPRGRGRGRGNETHGRGRGRGT